MATNKPVSPRPARIRRSVSFLPENLAYLQKQAATTRRSVNYLVNLVVESARKAGRSLKS